ncbi:MAG: hypothetical protein H7841_09915 [Magnetospirillum sp. WYHS-4]
MTEAPTLNPQALTAQLARDGSSLKTAREARSRAAVTQSDDSPALRGALGRLDRVLRGGAPPRTDVPRGYYVNIQV